MMAQPTAHVVAHLVVRQRWWLPWYLFGLWAMSSLTGLPPDPEKVKPWILRGFVVELRFGDVTCAM